ncbi:HU family DNA-binding protein [Saccharophagus sp. K07]|jgi:DNA-binding protein HU-beta|uniref:HU family DNA-binding protein n=1 Tax=Saccharophagus sp. K07 TaxID=2283636 RepID=UPI0016523DF3|nr:HU family DNA-binding protein [Saccharophagus sp. K07]MBC6904128.1 HU family DNA-binding protein [Saccharophagus sp. K07]
MRKPELVKAVAEIADLSERQADAVVSAVVEQITNALSRGESVNLVGFGSFSVKSRPARQGRNPKNGEAIQIPASNVPVFKAGKGLKDAISG